MSTPKRDRRSFFNLRYVRTERRKGTRWWAAILVLSIPLYFFFDRYVVSTGIVTDISMLPTLREGRYFLINKAAFHLGRPKRGDIVILRRFKNERSYYVKRVIGLEGETLKIASGRVWVNSRVLNEPYVTGQTWPNMGPFLIEKNYYFVLGDNRENSEDSRAFGSVPLESIEGKL